MQIPLFPLHTVLSPGIALPLHIFEDRYRVMVRRCLDTSTPFGIVLIRQGTEIAPRDGIQELSISSVGTFAEIREASKYVDGRWDLLTVGTGRFVIKDVIADVEPYLVGEVQAIEDALGDADEADALVTRVTRRFVHYLRLLQPRDGEEAEPIDVQVEVEVADDDQEDADAEAEATADDDDEGAEDDDAAEEEAREAPGGGPAELAAALTIPDDPSQLSFLLTGIVQVEPEVRQQLLEAVSAEARLRELDALLDRELVLLGKRLAPFQPDRRALLASAN